MNRHPPGLGFGPRRPSTSSPKQPKQNPSIRSNQRTGVLLPHNNRVAPPPPRASHASSLDPFSDDHRVFDPTRTVVYDSQQDLRTRNRVLPHSSVVRVQCPFGEVPAQVAAATDKDARSKLVAGILLNRVHASAKPIRRRSEAGGKPKTYVRSGLSRTLCV